MPSLETAATVKSPKVPAVEVEKELPPFTFKNVMLDIYHGLVALLYEPSAKSLVGPVVFALTSIIAKFVIRYVPYTEIDFVTYMQQIKLVNEGVLDYSMIGGDTGPMVYPAGFVQIYQVLRFLTNEGEDIGVAQSVFGYLLTFNNLLVLTAYVMVPDLPPWPLYGLLLSKRLVSIYVLRLFNDCFTTAAMIGVTVFLQQASYWYSTSTLVSFFLTIIASDLFSWAISIKMNALLYVPGFLIVSYFLVGENLWKFFTVIAVIPIVQVLIGWKFLLPLFHDEEANIIRWNYINQAFDFKRQFLYKWSVNWKFVSEDFFLSREFATILLALNLSVLFLFVLTRFLNERIIGKSLPLLLNDAFIFKTTIVKKKNLIVNQKHGPKLVLMILSTTNVIGILFARSLHYQFLSWYCWQLPVLIYWANWNIVVSGLVWILHELCWNVYPSTWWSSALLITILSTVLVRVWWNENAWFEGEAPRKKKRKQF